MSLSDFCQRLYSENLEYYFSNCEFELYDNNWIVIEI